MVVLPPVPLRPLLAPSFDNRQMGTLKVGAAWLGRLGSTLALRTFAAPQCGGLRYVERRLIHQRALPTMVMLLGHGGLTTRLVHSKAKARKAAAASAAAGDAQTSKKNEAPPAPKEDKKQAKKAAVAPKKAAAAPKKAAAAPKTKPKPKPKPKAEKKEPEVGKEQAETKKPKAKAEPAAKKITEPAKPKAKKATKKAAVAVDAGGSTTSPTVTTVVEDDYESCNLLEDDSKTVVVVESPTKAKTIEKYLGGNYVVLPSYGHVRDLARRSGSVRPQDDFDLVWEIQDTAKGHLSKIKTALKGASRLVLASDPDREGEAIAWHLHELLKADGAVRKDVKVHRVTFNEITKSAVEAGMRSPRGLSRTLVDAYLARRALDYLIGFDISPLLWRKLPGSKSAGRVQSAALCLLAERETEIEGFTPREYWTVEAEIGAGKASFPARLTSYKGVKLEQFTLKPEEAEAAAKYIEKCKLKVESRRSSEMKKNPPGPYITSSLQQDASNKLGFGAARTMALAQKLYEGVKLADDEQVGLITYMRTDSQQMSDDAMRSIREFGAARYGAEYVPAAPRVFKSKVKNAQEAHEAIRPTDIRRLPAELVSELEPDALRLYGLIWRRTMASQLVQAVFNQVALNLEDSDNVVKLRSTASVPGFAGFNVVFQDKGALASDKEDEEPEVKLPALQPGNSVSVKKVNNRQHFTEPPPRYNDGSLVRKLEELGIGRPSTYASILKTLQLRQYTKTEGHRIFPEVRGRMVAVFLSHYFTEFVNYKFTAKMEEQLDSITSGSVQWKDVLRQFWPDFHEKVTTTSQISNQKVGEVLSKLFKAKLGAMCRTCPDCGSGQLELRLTRFGAGYFLGCSNYPTCKYLNSLDDSENEEWNEAIPPKPSGFIRVLGVDPKTGMTVSIKPGPFGSYIQVGEDAKGKLKPKRVKIPVKLKVDDIDLEAALKLAQYPITLGYTEEGKVVTVGVGKSGCYIRVHGYSVFVPWDVKVEDLTLESALQIVEQGKEARRRVQLLARMKQQPAAAAAAM